MRIRMCMVVIAGFLCCVCFCATFYRTRAIHKDVETKDVCLEELAGLSECLEGGRWKPFKMVCAFVD